MKSKTLKRKTSVQPAVVKRAGAKRTFSDVIRSAQRGSAYAFVAGLGIWLPRAEAATLINLNATPLPVGPLSTWTNTGTVVGDFTAIQATNPPIVGFAGGVKSVEFTALGGANNGQSYIGPEVPAGITGAGARTVEAWLFNPTVQGEESIFAWGARNTPAPGPVGENWSFGHGTSGGAAGDGFGAVGMWGAPDIGWSNQEDANVLQYAVATYDGATTRCYLDGALVSTENTSINTIRFITNGVVPFRFRMARQNSPTGGIDATGTPTLSVARLRVHDVALDDTTITNQYNLERAEFISLATTDGDGDGIPNWYEELYGLNMSANDAAGDLDTDGSTNLQEYTRNTKANDSDTDDDGYLDGVETGTGTFVSLSDTGTNPLLLDTDGDTLRDGIETRTLAFVDANNPGTSPVDRDTDDDGFMDHVEIARGTNPTSAASLPPTDPVVRLDAAGLPIGALTTWTNIGTIGSNFVAEAGGGVVQSIQGVVAVAMPGPAFTGPSYIGPAPTQWLFGNNSYSIEAWIHNPAAAPEETVFSWGRRGADGQNAAFNHGLADAFGAMGHWGGQDLGWGPDANVKQNVWTHIAYTYDAAAGIQRCYSDGVEANTETIGPLAIDNLGANNVVLPFRIAAQNENNGTPTADFRGSLAISELRVYEFPLTASTITNNFTAGAGKYGLVDYDQDGLPTWYERQYPAFLNETNAADAQLDQDLDGLLNLAEFTNFSDPTKTDTDGDGLTDGNEVNTLNLNSTNPDTDYDGLPDGREVALATNPLAVDSDNDGFADSMEVLYASDPNVTGSTPNTTTPRPMVNLDATALPAGPLAIWNSSNALAYAFTALGSTGVVQTVDATKGVTFDGDDSYLGPLMPQYLGGNANWTVEAWIFNPVVGDQETVLAWGRRGGNPDGSDAAFIHGSNTGFGAVGLWGTADVAWGTNAAHIAQNVVGGRWTFVAYTHNSANSLVSLFKDGQFVHSEFGTNAPAGEPINIHTFDPSDPRNSPGSLGFGRYLPFRIGAQSDAGGFISGPFATMTIAKARIYDQTLSAAQIAATYNAERVQFPGQPRITNVRVNPTNGFVSFDWVPAPGRTYEVLRNSDITNPNGWSSIATGQGSGSFTNNPGGAPMNFYKLRLE